MFEGRRELWDVESVERDFVIGFMACPIPGSVQGWMGRAWDGVGITEAQDQTRAAFPPPARAAQRQHKPQDVDCEQNCSLPHAQAAESSVAVLYDFLPAHSALANFSCAALTFLCLFAAPGEEPGSSDTFLGAWKERAQHTPGWLGIIEDKQQN